MEAHGDSLIPQPGPHRHNARRPRPRSRRGHVAPADWKQRRRRSPPPQFRSAGHVVSKSVTKELLRSSLFQQNRGIMRFHFARFTLPKPFVTDLDIGLAVGPVRSLYGPLDPDALPDYNQSQTQNALPRVTHPPPGPTLCSAAGDIPCGRVQSAPAGDVRRRRGQESCPRTREMPPVVGKSPRPRRMSPSVAGRRPRCTAGFGGVVGLRLGRAARPGQLAHAGSPRRAVGPAPGRCSPHAWPQHRRRPPVVRRSARSTAPAP